MKLFLTILIPMLLFTSCQGEAAIKENEFSVPRQLTGIAYGKDSMQRMDAWLPAGRTADHTPAIILIHGGGWNGGHRSEFLPYIDSFQKRLPGYAVFTTGYRLVNGSNLFPTQENDIKSAVDHIVNHAAEYGISSEKLVLLGFSAGGHLALLQAYKYEQPRIKAVIDFFGPTDLVTMYKKPWHPLVPLALQMVTGKTPVSDPSIYDSSSPIQYVTEESPPTLIIHGTRDPVVDISQSRSLGKKLQEAGVHYNLVEYKGMGHGWRGPQMSDAYNQIVAFLEKTVN